MILVYHDIKLFSNNENTVSSFVFFTQMLYLYFSKKEITYLKDYNNPNTQVVITFDDGFKNILKYAIPILKIFKFPYEVFIVETYLNNKHTEFINKNELDSIINNNGRLQYHSYSHKNLTSIEDIAQLEKEIVCPQDLKVEYKNCFEYFAYPYWEYNNAVVNIIKKYYIGARSGNGKSNNSIWALNSIKVKNNFKLKRFMNEY